MAICKAAVMAPWTEHLNILHALINPCVSSRAYSRYTADVVSGAAGSRMDTGG